jgi:thioredoxin-like negative regulator of GroEL
MHIYSSLMGVKEPREFKQAVRHFLKREWEEARDLVDALIRRSPDYRPARLFMIELKMRLGDFDGAESSLVEIQSDLDTETLQSIQQDIVLRRRIETRKKESIQPSPSDYASSAVESEA